MLKITLIQIGKTKDDALQSLVSDFYKRVGGSVSFDEVTVKNESALWDKVNPSHYNIVLEDSGKEFTSNELSQFIETRKNQGDSHLVFLIGPVDGFSSFPVEPNLKLSLSKMTFSHQTIRLILAEQIYRSISILEGKPYATH